MRNEIINTVKDIIKRKFHYADCGIFFTRNEVGDPMMTIYADGVIQIDICYEYSYFEIFGLTDDEQEVVENYYHRLEMMHA